MNIDNIFYGRIIIAIILLVGVFYTNEAFAQHLTDSIPAIKVHGRHKDNISDVRIKDYTPGQKKIIIDSITLQQYQLQSLSNLISQQTPVFVKSYGFNSLATLNFRGSSAAQSEVLWNGVPIQNAALGIADVSQLPVMLLNRVSIIYGSSSALLGSGNVGGALLVEGDKPRFDTSTKNISLAVAAGSYGQYMAGLKAQLGFKKWFFSFAAFTQSAQNDFSYSTLNGNTQQLSNSQLQSRAFLFQANYKMDHADVLGIYIWTQQYDRHIPPALFETSSIKEQTDGSTRFLLDWKRHLAKDESYAKISFIHDATHYTDSAILVNTLTPVYQFYFDAGWKHTINANNSFLLYYPVQVSWSTYNNKPEQQFKAAIAAAYDTKLLHNKLDLVLNARGETINDVGIFSPGINASYACNDNFLLRANIQHTYRAPNLNELYYFPGGNPNLKPEQGWSEDAGYELKFISDNITVKHDLSLFSRDIHDWILWFGGAFWTPHNIAEVWSRGAETENTIEYKTGKWNLHLGFNIAYIIATTQNSYVVNDGSVGKQIPYTPLYNGQANIGFTFGRLSFNYNHSFTGTRYITVDESESIQPYSTGNIQFFYDLPFNKKVITLSGQCNNIWNQQYQVVAFRPMPGTNFLFGLRLALQ